VEVVETHMSWVFLTPAHAWKLKKPERVDHVDLSSVEARHHHCRLELRLNRRFSHDVYLDVVALTEGAGGRLALGASGTTVDWLLQMRRLPRALMLDQALAGGRARPEDAQAIAEHLGGIYRACPPEPVGAEDYRARLARRIDSSLSELAAVAPRELRREAAEIARAQHAFLSLAAGLFDERVEDGRIVEGHGDLRPEHICLEAPPRVIDCLEFDRALRVTDCAAEIGFLALECERLGAPGWRELLLAAYGAACADSPPDALVHFHQSLHACTRAWLALRHLRAHAVRDPARWEPLARDYLRLAGAHLEGCVLPKL